MTTVAAPPATRLLAGYHALGRAATLRDHFAWYGPLPAPRDRLIRIVEESGLTGRGGGAFPTGRKMRSVAASGRPAVVVVNAAEGEPASGKDRLLLTVAPHLVLDGAVLAASAVGAREIFICVHDQAAAAGAEAALAERSSATPIRVRAISGGYVASEETALISHLSGGDGRPLLTRPYERGVGGRPTMVSNAETYAHIALIARYGPEWFRSCGSPDAPGTALFTISGAVAAPGVVEAPLGTSVGDLLRMAGGPAEPVQAVLTGGYGGSWLHPSLLHRPATPSVLKEAGATLGPGIVIALPSRACGIAESARVLGWLAGENAGQCGPCVFGLPAIASDFAAIAAGQADETVHERLSRRLSVIPGRGACRHPDGAVRFALSALRVFESHLGVHHRGGCPAARRPGVLPVPGRP
jgi:NADH:ubiquinone oxidoreductase subunit F (NADH-binding)